MDKDTEKLKELAKNNKVTDFHFDGFTIILSFDNGSKAEITNLIHFGQALFDIEIIKNQ